jgi:hypothetical protein
MLNYVLPWCQNVNHANREVVILPLMHPEQYPVEANMQVRVKENADQVGKCGCGRSPTGKCIGWHGLTEQAFKEKLQEYKLNEGK